MKANKKIVVGVDEVGRGPFAGPVVVCACALHKPLPRNIAMLVTDSKKLTDAQRKECFNVIETLVRGGDVSYALARISSKVIDMIGVGKATQRAVHRALKKLNLNPEHCDVRLDGLLSAPDIFVHQRTIVKGDLKEKSIGLASIIAKLDRDGYMERQARKYPEYGFEQHKGYGTAQHRAQISRYGLSPLHRRSFIKQG